MERRVMDNPYGLPRAAPGRILKCSWSEPRCFAPLMDATRARQAYGRWALPKLARELCDTDHNVIRQAVTTIGDISANPEELIRIVELRVPEKLANLLISEDSYLRERVAMVYGTMSRQAAGRQAILKYPKILQYLSKGLVDNLSVVRMKMAEVIENLSRDPIAAEDLWHRGFLQELIEVIDSEKNMIILEALYKPKYNEEAMCKVLLCILFALHLESLGALLNNGKVNVNIQAIEINAMEKLVTLLNIKNKDERVIIGTLVCLARLCQEAIGKRKSIEMDLLSIMKLFINDQSRSVCKKAAAVIVFATITTRGKLRALELGIIDRLVKLATDTNDRELQLVSIQALSNIAEVPDGRKKLLSEHFISLADIDTCMDDTTEKCKNILMEIIHLPL